MQIKLQAVAHSCMHNVDRAPTHWAGKINVSTFDVIHTLQSRLSFHHRCPQLMAISPFTEEILSMDSVLFHALRHIAFLFILVADFLGVSLLDGGRLFQLSSCWQRTGLVFCFHLWRGGSAMCLFGLFFYVGEILSCWHTHSSCCDIVLNLHLHLPVRVGMCLNTHTHTQTHTVSRGFDCSSYGHMARHL